MDGACVINLDEYESIETDWMALYGRPKIVIYFGRIRVEHILKRIRKFIRNKNMATNIYRTQAYDSIMCGYFCIGFINLFLYWIY